MRADLPHLGSAALAIATQFKLCRLLHRAPPRSRSPPSIQTVPTHAPGSAALAIATNPNRADCQYLVPLRLRR